MAHKLVGSVVTYTRPVVIKPGFERENEETHKPELVPAVIDMVPVPATVVGVEPRFDDEGKSLCPNLHLAFLHADRLHHLPGSGWRDAFDRAISVRPKSHPDVFEKDEDHIPYYFNEAVGDECYWIRKTRTRKATDAKNAADKAEAEKKAAAEKAEAEKRAAERQAEANGGAASADSNAQIPLAPYAGAPLAPPLSDESPTVSDVAGATKE
jgi:hypothetical protein